MRPAVSLRPILLAALIAAPALVFAQTPKPVAIVNGVALTEQDFKTAEDDLGPTLQRMDPKQRQKYVTDYLIDLKLVAGAAEKQKLDQTPDFARVLAHLRNRALMETLREKPGAEATSGDKVEKFYGEALKGLPAEEEAHARHILVPTEEEAKKVVDRLKAGEDFAKVAGEVSKDPGSGKEGGDLCFFTKDKMVKPFADAAFALKGGEVSAPVKSDFGLHVIKLEEKRVKPLPTLNDVKDELSRYLMQKAQQDMIVKLRSEAKIERFDEPAAAEKPAAMPAEKPAEQPKK